MGTVSPPVTGKSGPGPVGRQLKLPGQALQGLGPESDLAPERALRVSSLPSSCSCQRV
jgi:hypothetical protein